MEKSCSFLYASHGIITGGQSINQYLPSAKISRSNIVKLRFSTSTSTSTRRGWSLRWSAVIPGKKVLSLCLFALTGKVAALSINEHTGISLVYFFDRVQSCLPWKPLFKQRGERLQIQIYLFWPLLLRSMFLLAQPYLCPQFNNWSQTLAACGLAYLSRRRLQW